MYIFHFQFGKVLQYYGHHQVFLDRPITLLVPTNEAMLKYKGKRQDNLLRPAWVLTTKLLEDRKFLIVYLNMFCAQYHTVYDVTN